MQCRAVCTDCRWSFESESHESVTDALERHSRKEHHHVNFRRVEFTSA